MKKKLLFCLAALGVSSMLFGFDSAETADSLMGKIQEAAAASAGLTMELNVNADIDLETSIIPNDASASTVSSRANLVRCSGTFHGASNTDPFAAAVGGSMDLSANDGSENYSLSARAYSVPTEDGKMDSYFYVEDSSQGVGRWLRVSPDSLNINVQAAGNFDISQLGIDFTLAPGTVDVNGTECYLLSSEVAFPDFQTRIADIAQEAGQDLTSNPYYAMVLSFLEKFKINFAYYVDASTFLPVSLHMDLNDSDLSELSSMLTLFTYGVPEEGASYQNSLNLILNDLSVDVSMTYGEAAAITVPEEALSAEDYKTVMENASEELGQMLGQSAG